MTLSCPRQPACVRCLLPAVACYCLPTLSARARWRPTLSSMSGNMHSSPPLHHPLCVVRGRYPTIVHVWKHHVQGTLNFDNRGKTPDALRAMLKVMLDLLRSMEALAWCSDKMNPYVQVHTALPQPEIPVVMMWCPARGHSYVVHMPVNICPLLQPPFRAAATLQPPVIARRPGW